MLKRTNFESVDIDSFLLLLLSHIRLCLLSFLELKIIINVFSNVISIF